MLSDTRGEQRVRGKEGKSEGGQEGKRVRGSLDRQAMGAPRVCM